MNTYTRLLILVGLMSFIGLLSVSLPIFLEGSLLYYSVSGIVLLIAGLEDPVLTFPKFRARSNSRMATPKRRFES